MGKKIDEACPACGDGRLTRCMQCDGIGRAWLHGELLECPDCAGSGQVPEDGGSLPEAARPGRSRPSVAPGGR